MKYPNLFLSFFEEHLFLNISIIFSRICWQTGDPRPIFTPKGLDLSWMLLLYQIIITITCWHQLFQITSLFNQFTSLLALNCSCPNFFWNVLQVWMTGKDVYLQMTWSWPDKTWNILCSYCLQWNTSQSKFRNHYFLFYLRFPYCPNFFWFGVVHHVCTYEIDSRACKTGAFSSEWILKNCNVSDWPLRWRTQNMSLIGCIAQRCKNMLDSLLNLFKYLCFHLRVFK